VSDEKEKIYPASETTSFLADRAAFRAAGREIASCLLDSLNRDEVNEIQSKLLARASRLWRDHEPKSTRMIVYAVCEGINEALSKKHRSDTD
jgi:hypothetical protein